MGTTTLSRRRNQSRKRTEKKRENKTLSRNTLRNTILQKRESQRKDWRAHLPSGMDPIGWWYGMVGGIRGRPCWAGRMTAPLKNWTNWSHSKIWLGTPVPHRDLCTVKSNVTVTFPNNTQMLFINNHSATHTPTYKYHILFSLYKQKAPTHIFHIDFWIHTWTTL